MKRPIPKPDDGDHFTIAEWDEMLGWGVFNPDDGSGYYATATEYDNDRSVWGSIRPEWATHVVWYNK